MTNNQSNERNKQNNRTGKSYASRNICAKTDFVCNACNCQNCKKNAHQTFAGNQTRTEQYAFWAFAWLSLVLFVHKSAQNAENAPETLESTQNAEFASENLSDAENAEILGENLDENAQTQSPALDETSAEIQAQIKDISALENEANAPLDELQNAESAMNLDEGAQGAENALEMAQETLESTQNAENNHTDIQV